MTKFKIFMLDKGCENYRSKIFSGLRLLKSLCNTTPNGDDYKLVYSGEIECKNESDLAICERLFHKFNVNHPSDYNERSLSVSDVIYINDNYYFCDSFGFTKLEW